MAPGIGALLGPYLQKGEWQVNASVVQFATDNQFGGGTFAGDQQRTDLYAKNSEVKEGGLTLDVQGTYALTNQWNIAVDAPFGLQDYWSTVIAGTRYYQYAHGPNDIVIGGRRWLLNCDRYKDQNISIGLGVRLPVGNANYQVLYPNSLGQNFALRPVFPGIQQGSGAWGLPCPPRVSSNSAISPYSVEAFTF